jgi:predicted lipoprotein with Yx(FWY)xxD motif
MQKLATRGLTLLLGTAALLTALAALAAGPSYGAAGGMSASQRVVKSAQNRSLDRTVLVDRRGKTLYTLSAETHGRFICTTKVCLSLWTPLVVAHGTTPAGAKLLATVRRPDGRTQVTYRGRPLYTFTEDTKPGDVKGNGFKDVGTWLAATTNGTATATATPPSGGGYSYP